MIYNVEFRSFDLVGVSSADEFRRRIDLALSRLPDPGWTSVYPGFSDEFGGIQYVRGLQIGRFRDRDECEAYAVRVRELLAPLGIDPESVTVVGYEPGGCGPRSVDLEAA